MSLTHHLQLESSNLEICRPSYGQNTKQGFLGRLLTTNPLKPMHLFLHFLVFNHKHFENNPKYHQNNLKPTKNQRCGELGFFLTLILLLHFFFLSFSLYLNKWNLEMENKHKKKKKKMAFFSSNGCPSSHFAQNEILPHSNTSFGLISSVIRPCLAKI